MRLSFRKMERLLFVVKKVHDKLQFSVSDQGIGIAAKELAIIFDSFGQATNRQFGSHKGAGLGLSITKQLIELQGGEIWVESTEGVGSTFTFELPLEEAPLHDDSQVLTEKDLKNMGAAVSGLDVLLVEDDEFNMMIAKDELEWYIPALKLTEASDGRSAFNLWLENEYDLVISDIQLPDINGYELSMKIRAEEKKREDKRRTAILAMTASVISKDIDRCLAAGMDGYIPKPFRSHDFVTAIL